MGKKKKKRSRKDLIKRARGYQIQFNEHQQKIMENPRSLSINHWKNEKTNFLSRINYYLSKAKMNSL